MDENKDLTLNRPGSAGNGPPAKKKRNYVAFVIGGIALILVLALLISSSLIKQSILAGRTAPELSLKVVEGPDLEGGKYRYLVKAVVTGKPVPEVTFSRDDSVGEAGVNQALILLVPGENVIVTAVAENSLGSMQDSLEIAAEPDPVDEDGETEGEGTNDEETEDPAVNHDPVISGIALPTLFTDTEYSIMAEASDADDDSLSYHWEVTGSAAVTATGNPATLSTPAYMGKVTLTLTVRDGHGGEATHSEEITINPVLRLAPVPGETGYVVKDIVAAAGDVFAGDGAGNDMVRGFFSFDTAFAFPVPFTVHKAELRLSSPNIVGDPTVFHSSSLGLWVGMVDWGARPLQLADYSLPGTGIANYTDYDTTLTSIMGESSEKLAKEIQDRLHSGAPRLQFRLHFAKDSSNGNNAIDGVFYGHTGGEWDISLEVYLLIDLE